MKPLGHGLAVACLLALVATAGCGRAEDTPNKPTSITADTQEPATTDPPTTAAPRAEWATVFLKDKDGREHKVEVEVVRTTRAIRRGLMYRQHMAEDKGMLFLMGKEEVQSFWMRNTLIPLDMVFIRKDLTVAGIIENTEPLDETSRSVGKPSSYVLEVNGGWIAKHGISAESTVRFEGVAL